ncbi:MAG: hypothetical protein R3E89_11935 [Thiolinea sp.]
MLHYRAMQHKIAAPHVTGIWAKMTTVSNGITTSAAISRHTDVDLLALYTGRANAPLDELATLYGFPGKMGMSGAKVWDAYQDGQLADIRNYCETDVLNTWLVYLRFELMRGHIDAGRYERETAIVQVLKASGKSHLEDFERAWEAGA